MTRFTKAFLVTAVGLAAGIGFQGCTTITENRVPGGTMIVNIPDLPETGFLSDYSKLTLARSDEFAVNGRKIYISPTADLSVYSKVIIEEPSFAYFQSNVDLTEEDKGRLARYLTEWLRNKVKDRFLVVEEPGPDVARIRTAITRFELPKDVTDEEIKLADLGTMTSELEMVDSITGAVILQMIDRASGVRFTIAREDLAKEKEVFFDWLDGFHAEAERAAAQAQTPQL